MNSQAARKEGHERGTVPAEVSDGDRLDFSWVDAKCSPVSWSLDVVEIPTLNLVGAECRPPYVLRKLRKEESSRLWESWRAGGRAVGDGLHKGQKVFVGECTGARKRESSRHSRRGKYVRERLSDVQDLSSHVNLMLYTTLWVAFLHVRDESWFARDSTSTRWASLYRTWSMHSRV
jgi:hypothetical protein